MRGIVTVAGYVPHHRLSRSEVGEFFGRGGGTGTRSVASYDEDTTTMGTEAARCALRAVPGIPPDTLWFATTEPAYLDKTNATTIHAALNLPGTVSAFDFGGALRSGTGALLAGLVGGHRRTLVAGADLRDGLPTSADETSGGDGAGAAMIADDTTELPVIAEYLGGASVTDEFVDRWRAPGARRSRTWEERFGETRYVPLGSEVWSTALEGAGMDAEAIDRVAVTGMHARGVGLLSRSLGVRNGVLADDLVDSIGQAGCAHPLLMLASMLEQASPGEVIALVSLADGADALVFRATDALARWTPPAPLAGQIERGVEVSYGRFLSWRGMVEPEPPRRPEPQRVSSSAAWRGRSWKFGFVGSRDVRSEAVHLPPSRVSRVGGSVDDMVPVALADAEATIATYTIDHLSYSASPPIVFAVVDFDGGGRFPVELTDVDPHAVTVGDRVGMTFRRLSSTDGIHNYFWKARPVYPSGTGT
ncbi:MAG: OB-fold domain-containing protein [Acidimicrobiales bacterium]